LYSKLSIVLLLIVFASVAKASFGVYKKERESRLNALHTASQLSELQEREEGLSKDIDRLQNADGIEEEIRKKYTLGKDGESMIVIVDSGDEKATTTAAAADAGGMFEKLKAFFHL